MRHARFALGFGFLLVAPVSFAQLNFTVVARTGQAAPGVGAAYDVLSTPAINANGQVAFEASLAGAGINLDNGSAIFAGNPAGPGLVVRNGAAAVGEAAGRTLAGLYFDRPRFNVDGHVLFASRLHGPGIDPANNDGTVAYWLAGPGTLQKVVDVSGAPYRVPLLTANDLVSWSPSNGIHFWTPANPSPYAFISDNVVEQSLLSPAGQVAYNHGNGVVFGPADNLQTVASGEATPGIPGTTLSSSLYPVINAAGQVAFHAYISPGTGPNGEGDESFWVGTAGNLQLVARQRTVAPGTGGMRYGDFATDLDTYRTAALASSGQVAFISALTDDDGVHGYALFAGKPGQVHLVAKTGDHAANAPALLKVGELRREMTYNINGPGQVVFGDGSGNLYAGDADGALLLVAGVGLPFQLAPGDVRTISSIEFGETPTGGEDGRAFGLNDAGQLTFGLTFTDNSSAVVFTSVPEPGAIGVIALVGCGLGCRRSRRV